MSTATLPQIDIGGGKQRLVPKKSRWIFPKKDTTVYECRVLICPEAEGGYSVHATKLPGVSSQGETVAEALHNIEEAFRGAIADYKANGEDIPWDDAIIDRTEGSLERWILVNV